MAIFKCKMCGGDLDVQEGLTTCECEYCGTKQTIPTLDDEKKISLFARANKLRFACEFDKAAGVYEGIVEDFPEEAEGYWGLILCKYGIEYVDDPVTDKKIPTCHRSSFDSLMDDSDFEMVMENADVISRKLYREEAKAIEELRKSIVQVSSAEEPYDIFICYKETDENGDRTIDSEIAQDVYTALTEKGYRVFFARITLEDKLGQEYEPYIFAALNSAKVMLAFGTDYEYYNAVWVKNEWSRFLKLISKGEKKTLIPCYKNIDAYDMPKEFAKLQAQDMGKVGAIQDLVRGIEKLIPKQEVIAQVKEPVVVNNGANVTVDSLLKRVFMFLADGEWQNANEYCEKVLDIDPENGQAYLGKLMVDLRIKNIDDFIDVKSDYESNKNYKKVILFGDETTKTRLGLILKRIKSEIAEKEFIEAEIKRKEAEAEAKRKQKEEEKKLALVIKKRNNLKAFGKFFSAGETHLVGLKTDGTVLATGDNFDGGCEVSDWEDIIAISAGCGHTVGLKIDGTVIATQYNGDEEFYFGQCDLSDWNNISVISAGWYHTVGLKSDGTVVALGENLLKQCDVENWTDIVDISAGGGHTTGLKADGTVIAVGSNNDGECNVEEWSDIVGISAGCDYTVGLKSNGTVVAVGNNKDGQCDVENWTDIVAISAGRNITIGLKSDGSIVVTSQKESFEDIQNIVAISAGFGKVFCLKSDGTVVSLSEKLYDYKFNQWKLFDNMKNIEKEQKKKIENKRKMAEAEVEIAKRKEEKKAKQEAQRKLSKLICTGHSFSAAVNSDGKVVSTVSGIINNTKNWKNIVSVEAKEHLVLGVKDDGTVVSAGSNSGGADKISGWSNIVSVSVGYLHSVGLKSDGTVVAVGDNKKGQCDVEDWTDIVAVAAGDEYTIGLKSNGKIVSTQPLLFCEASNVVDIVACRKVAAVLQSHGDIVVKGGPYLLAGQVANRFPKDVVKIAVGDRHVVGLKSTGTVVAEGDNSYGQCDVGEWRNVIAIAACGNHTIGLKKDGTFYATGDNDFDQGIIKNWKIFNDIREVTKEKSNLNDQQLQYRSKGLCQHCGGEFKGFIGKKCVKCGKPKDY